MHQYAPGGAGPHVRERLRIFEGPLDGLPHLLLQPVQASHIVPAHVGHLHQYLPQGAGPHLPQGLPEVVGSYPYALQCIGGDAILLQVHLRYQTTQGPHGRLLGERLQVGAHKAVGHPGHLL